MSLLLARLGAGSGAAIVATVGAIVVSASTGITEPVTGAASLARVTASAQGVASASGSVGASLGGLSALASASISTTSTAQATLRGLTLTASGSVSATGSGSSPLPALVGDVRTAARASASASVQLRAVTFSGTCQLGVGGSISCALGGITAAVYDPRGGSHPYGVGVVEDARTAVVEAVSARTCSLTWAARTSVVTGSARTLIVTEGGRSVVLTLRGLNVANFSIFSTDNAPALDVQLLGDGVAVILTGATVVGEWTHESGVTGSMTFSVINATEGRIRHTWATGEAALMLPGSYALRVTATFPSGSILTYPDPDQAPIKLRIVR